MKKINSLFGILVIELMLIPIFVLANGAHQNEIEEGRKLVESGVSCDELSDEQLEAIGEYYMEQMHPGEAHETMHKMMGIKEDTEYHEQFHINFAERMYCGDYVGCPMMETVLTNYSTNVVRSRGMMGRGMMGNSGGMMMPMMMGGRNMMGGGMLSNTGFGYGYSGFWNIIWYLFWIGIIVLVIWLIYKFIIQKGVVSETSISILKKRYAKGEISKKEYESMKKELGER